MKIIQHLIKSTLLFLILFLSVNFTSAQNAPKQEKLLNGLKLLTWKKTDAAKSTVKLRIHSGSSFDPQNKEGVMTLLSKILFPNEQIREYFADELNGDLEVVSTYDYIQINASGDNDKILTILENIAQAVIQPQIDKETTAKLLKIQSEKIKEAEANPAYLADRAVSRRLLGDFPYGRAQDGTAESLGKIDFADLLFAEERFLTADNATLTITGNFKQDLVNRAVRRYFGSWRKSEKKVPSTFEMAGEPKETFAVIESPSGETGEIRYAMRGLARKDKDFYASKILAEIFAERLREKNSAGDQNSVFVRYDGNILPGLLIYGISVLNTGQFENSDGKSVTDRMTEILNKPVTNDEFTRSKTKIAGKYILMNAAELWLDVETYKLDQANEELKKVQAVTPADVSRTAEKLKNQPLVSVLVVKPRQTEQ